MKKIFIFLLVLGALTSINFDLFASSYNDPVSGQNITVDTLIPALNNLSLKQVFNDNGLASNPYFKDGVNNWTLINTSYTIIDDRVRFTPNSNNTAQLIQYIPVNIGDTYYAFLNIKTNNPLLFFELWEQNGIQTALQINQDGFYSIMRTITNVTTLRFDITTFNTTSYSNLLMNVINLSDLGITASQVILDYYYQIYQALNNGVDLSIFYNQGLGVGYGNGLEDYHNGFYNYLDPTQGVPFNDGYNTGFIDGGVNGYNNGLIDGYDNGYSDGVLEEVDTQWMLGFVSGAVNILGVSIIPGISLGVFVFIPLFLGFIGFIFRLGGRRG